MRQRLGALTRRLDAARAGEVEAIHQARVATRRLREALPLLAAGGKRRKLERAVRRLTRALGPVRELDVALQNLDEQEGAVPAPALSHVRHALAAERRAARARAARTLDRTDPDTLRKRAIAAARRAHTDDTAGAARGAGAARQRTARRAERLRTAVDAAAGMYLPDRLHDVRVEVKKLRYALEMVGGGRRPASKGVSGQLRVLTRAQDLLGRMHDLEVLIAFVRGVQSTSSVEDLRLSVDLDRLVRQLETECRRLHGHYMSTRDRLLSVCDQVSAAAARAVRAPAA